MDHNNQKKPKKLKSIIFLLFSVICFYAFSFKPAFSACSWQDCYSSQSCTPLNCDTCPWCGTSPYAPSGEKKLGEFEGLGPLGTIIKKITSGAAIGEPINLLNKVISIVIGLITLIAFLYFMFQFFTAGLSWVTAGGDQKKIESASNKITNGIIGIVIVVSAIFIVDLIGTILGIKILNPFEFIIDIWK